MNIKYTISILAHNKLEFTRKCVESVIANSSHYRLVLTDNGSTDGTGEYFEEVKERLNKGQISEEHLICTVVRSKINEGFIEPNNRMLLFAVSDYLVLLNNDTEVPPGWLQALEQPFLTYPKAAISGVAGGHCGLKIDHPKYPLLGVPGKHVEYIEGACLMVKLSCLKGGRLFPDWLEFAYCEDTELSLRMRMQGYTIHQVAFPLVHHGSKTSQSVPGIQQIMLKNMAAVRRRWAHYFIARRMDYPVLLRRKGAIGDVLLTTPVIKALKEAWPLAKICVETDNKAVLENNPHVYMAQEKFSETWIQSEKALVVELDYEQTPNRHIVESYFASAGLPFVDPVEAPYVTEMFPSADHVAKASRFLNRPGRWVAIHPGPTTWPGKNWPVDRWVEVCKHLIGAGWNVLLVGTERPAFAHPFPCTVDSRSQTDVLDLAALMKFMTLFVGLDSFPLHCAQAMGVPVIGLFGATRSEFILTQGSPVYGINADQAKAPCAGERHRVIGSTFTRCDGDCMNTITVEQVVNAVKEMV